MTTKGFVQKKSADRKPNYRVMFADVVVNPYYGTQVKYIIDLKAHSEALGSDYVDAQAEPELHCQHMSEVPFSHFA